MGQINYEVPGIIDVVKQPKCMACWATVVYMLYSWKNPECTSIEYAMDALGSDFRKLFDDDQDDCQTGGLPPDRMQDLADATGMQIEYQQCETPESILQILESYGPIIIIDDENPTPKFAIHARIITGIFGDGDASNTELKIIDPGTGTTYFEAFQDFVSKYEAMADASGWGIQMMHYPETYNTSTDDSNNYSNNDTNTNLDTTDSGNTDGNSDSSDNNTSTSDDSNVGNIETNNQAGSSSSNGSKDSEGLRLLDSGTWNGSASPNYQGGQVMHFEIKNVNVLGTTLVIDSNLGGNKSLIILPLQTVDMRFDCFGPEPMGWSFNVSSNSDAFIVAWKLYSTWIPGDAPNR